MPSPGASAQQPTHLPLRLALDLGTTTLAGRLLDGGGRTLAQARAVNPQASLGADILCRLELARAGRGAELQRLLVDGVNQLILELCAAAGVQRASIGAAALAANPGIVHLLLGEDVAPVLFPPHRPRFRGGQWGAASALGIELAARLFIFPLVSGYVGGDLVAFVFGQDAPAGTALYLDIGTNAELALHAGGRWWVTSVAAGPAFEGGEIRCGMAYGPGAVVAVRIEAEQLRCAVVGGGTPRGLCGSGLLSAVAAALQGSLVETNGSLKAPLQVETSLSRYLGEDAGGRFLRLYRDARGEVLLTQDDIRAFQLAKAAVRAAALCLLARAGLGEGDLDEVVITGAFGAALPLETLKRVAMLPEAMVDKVRMAPDGALAGAAKLLLDADGQAALATLTAALKPLPLSGTPAFEKAFLASIDF